MGPTTGSTAFSIERLEQRRLLCGALLDGAAGHAANGTLTTDAVDAPAESAGRNAEAGHVVAAFAQSNGGVRGGRVVWGEAAVIDGATVTTWAIVSKKDGRVMAAGATVPISLAQNMPARGTGPAGAFASLDFPAVVRDTTYFNHLEMHSQQNGHPAPPGSVNPDRNRVPHFDYHFYGVDEEKVRAIPPGPPVAQVPPDRLPAGYIQPGPSEAQMGRHSAPQWSVADPGPLSTIVIAGYVPDASQMHFVEPMISREVLLEQRDFTLNVPTPQTFDRDTLYPTRSEVVFQGGAHHFIYSDFMDTDPATPSGDAEPAYVPAPRQAAAGASGQAVTSADWLFAEGDEQDDGEEDTDDGEHLADVVH